MGKKEKIWQRIFFLDLVLVIFIAFSVFLYYGSKLKNGAEREINSRMKASIILSRLRLTASGGEKKEKNAKEKSQTLTLIFVGDVMLSRSVGRIMESRGDYKYPFLKIAALTSKADFAFANLEGPISNRGKNQGSIYSFRSDPRAIEGLLFAGFDAVSLANNHIWDWGHEALSDTIRLLKEKNIGTAGAGRNEGEANNPAIIILGDKDKELPARNESSKIGLLAYSNLYPEKLEARGENPGISHFNPGAIKEAIRRLRREVDIVIVSLHWGEEYKPVSNADQKQLARAFIDSGADLIVGHHPHVSQEVEKYKNGWIVYSLGNFVFDQNFSEETVRGTAARVLVENKKVIHLEPLQIKINETFQPYLESY